jgi:hypothetical protein
MIARKLKKSPNVNKVMDLSGYAKPCALSNPQNFQIQAKFRIHMHTSNLA